ncbi:MAG: hypothetical protein ABDH59_01525 [Fervidobacterium sp.]
MRKTVLIFVVLLSIYALGTVLSPFGILGNPALLKEDGTFLLKISPIFDMQIFQNLLTLDNINAILNEEEIVISPNTMEHVIQNGIKFSLPVNISAYAHLNLFGLRLIPYVSVDGMINMNLPKTFSQILFGNEPKVETNLESTIQNFAKSDLKLSIGGNVLLGDLFVNANFFIPVAYSYAQNTYAHAKYTSSATPACANLNVDAKLSLLSTIDIQNFGNNFQNPEKLLEQIQKLIEKDAGLNLGFGYGNQNFGFAIKDITIKPAKVNYGLEFAVNAYAEYQAEATDITFDATYTVSQPIFFKLLEPIQITDNVKITAYYKDDGFFMWGIAGVYALNGDWAAKIYAGLNLLILKAYYALGMFPTFYSHTIGVGFNVGLLNGDLQLTATTNDLNLIGSTTPGIGISLRLAGGL